MNPSRSTNRCFATALVVVISLAGCGPKPETVRAPVVKESLVEVQVQSVENKSRAVTEEVTGNVRAKRRAILEARLSSRIEQMPVVLGQKVRQDELLVRLDAGEIAARLQQAEAALQQAEQDWKRVAGLFEQQSVTRAEYDLAQSRQRIAHAAVAEAKAMSGYVEVRAPFDGVVMKKWASAGDLAIPGRPLVEIADPAVLQLECDVPESMAAHIKSGARHSVRVDGLPDELEAVVSEIAPGVDALSGTFHVILDAATTARLRPGQFVRIAMPLGERGSLRVPVAAVLQRGQLEIVFAVENQRAQLRLVKTGKRVKDEVEILSGLRTGDNVVIRGAGQLVDGQPVEVK